MYKRQTLFVAEVVVDVSHLRVFGDKAEQRFEFREPVLRLAEFRVVDVDEQVVGDFARVVVETPDAGRPVDVAAPAGVVIASGFRKIVACGEVRTPAFADAVLDLGREVGVVENAESPDTEMCIRDRPRRAWRRSRAARGCGWGRPAAAG